MTSNEECRMWYKEGYAAAMGDIQSRARKAAEEIMDKVFMPGETVNAERLEKLITRHFVGGI